MACPARSAQLDGLEADSDFCQRAVAECNIDQMRKKRNDLKSRGMASVGGADFFRRGRADSWTGELSMQEEEANEYIAGELMHECGYATSTNLMARHSKSWHLKRRELLSSIEGRVNRTVALTLDKLRHRL